MATDEPETDDAAAEPMDDDASDAGDAATAVHRGSGGRGKPGKKRVPEEFRQKVWCAFMHAQMFVGATRAEASDADHAWEIISDSMYSCQLLCVLAQVLDILQQNGFEDARVAKMGQDDILRLLACFNAAGIHFA